MDEDTERLYRNYEILSNFYQKYYVDLRTLDNTCDASKFPAPTIMNGRVAKYDQQENELIPGTFYQLVDYRCNAGYKISHRTSNKMFCQEYSWVGLDVSQN